MAAYDYWFGGRPLAPVIRTTGGFDYWYGGRPLPLAAGNSATGTVVGVEATASVGTISGNAGATGVVVGVEVTASVGTISGSGGVVVPPVVVPPTGGGGGRRLRHGGQQFIPDEIHVDARGIMRGVEVVASVGRITGHGDALGDIQGVEVRADVGMVWGRGIHNPTEEMIAILLAAA